MSLFFSIDEKYKYREIHRPYYERKQIGVNWHENINRNFIYGIPAWKGRFN